MPSASHPREQDAARPALPRRAAASDRRSSRRTRARYVQPRRAPALWATLDCLRQVRPSRRLGRGWANHDGDAYRSNCSRGGDEARAPSVRHDSDSVPPAKPQPKFVNRPLLQGSDPSERITTTIKRGQGTSPLSRRRRLGARSQTVGGEEVLQPRSISLAGQARAVVA